MKDLTILIKGYTVTSKDSEGEFSETFIPIETTVSKKEFQDVFPEGVKVVGIERGKKKISIPYSVVNDVIKNEFAEQEKTAQEILSNKEAKGE